MADIMTDTPTQRIPNTPTISTNTTASSITASLLFTQDAMQPEIKTEPPLEIDDYNGGYDDSSNSNEIQTSSPADITPKIRLTPASKLLASPTPKDPKRKFICPYENCTKSYGKSSHLRSHLTWHTGVKPFVCKELNCGKGFTRSDELNRHMRTHTGEKPFECVQCSKKFSRSDHLTKHLGTHAKQMSKKSEKNGNKRKSVTTDEEIDAKDDLGVHFMVSSSIASSKQHANTIFETQNENFNHVPEENSLRVKVERTEDDIPYNSYKNSMQPIVPEQANAEESPPSEQKSLPAVNVKPEVAFINERPHQCKECLRSFKRHDDLNRHVRTHTGYKPYPCTECEKRFLRSDHLKKHLKTHLKKKIKKT